METVQGYVILKAATFETGHGFALGHNPGAPSPFVTWQFTEGENGHRDYYWGRYGTSQAWAQRDFDRRVDDYQQLYHAAVKHTELGPEGVYRYYSTQRPVDIGTYPKLPDNQPLSIVNYDDDRRRPVADGSLMAWGELTYAKPHALLKKFNTGSLLMRFSAFSTNFTASHTTINTSSTLMMLMQILARNPAIYDCRLSTSSK